MLPCLFGLFGPSFELREKEEKRKKKDNSPLLELLGFAATKNDAVLEEDFLSALLLRSGRHVPYFSI